VVRIRDLAHHLDISIGTVSRALNDKSDVNALTRQKVREAAERLGYSPNQSGRSLRRGQTDLVGMIIPTGVDDRLISGVFLSVLDGLRRRLSHDGLDLAIFLHGDDENVFGSLKRISERGLVDGLVISNTLPHDPRIAYLLENRRPFVAFGRSLSGGGHAWVDPDFEGAVAEAVDRLVERGHRNIALLLPDAPTNYIRLIAASYRDAMRRRKFPIVPAWEIRRAAGEVSGAEAVVSLLAMEPRPSALLVSDWRHVVGIYTALAQRGLRPGADLSLVGILPEAGTKFLMPTLTTLQPDWAAIGSRLGDALLASIAGVGGRIAAERPQQVLMPAHYVAGQSVEGPGRAA
jgi:DNA-binding LacI/PurR family transcriptional regulator